MMTKQQAQEAVTKALRTMCQIPGDSFVIIDALTVEKPFGWVFFYDSKKYIETGHISDAIAGNGPAFVNKRESIVEFSGTRKSVQELILEFELKWGDQPRL